MKTVFIDGSAGTTGLRIHQRLAQRRDLKLLTLPESCRKDPAARRDAMSQSDAAFLCLPDDAAIEAADLMAGAPLTLLDTSTAHRTSPGWAYGFPELGPAFARAVQQGSRIAVPGCFFDNPFNVVVGDVVGLGLCNAILQLRVGSRVGAATFPDGNCQFPPDFCKYFGALAVSFFFFPFDIVPFRMSRHRYTSNNELTKIVS